MEYLYSSIVINAWLFVLLENMVLAWISYAGHVQLDALLVRMLGSTSALPAGLMQGTPTTSI